MVDSQRRIVFCNAACAEFLGVSLEAILGEECLFGIEEAVDESAPPGRRAASCLCPSPEVFAGTKAEGWCFRVDAEGQLRRHLVRFFRLTDASGELLGIVGVIDPKPTEPAPSPVDIAETEAEEVHRLLGEAYLRMGQRLRLEPLIGVSAAIERVRRQILAAASCGADVLVVGPRGSGRRRVAQAIHYNSPDGPAKAVITLACDLLDGELIVSTVQASLPFRPGPEELPLGTVVLLEVDQLSRELQHRLGELLKERNNPVRIIGTASHPLRTLAQERQCDPLLAELLSTLVIELPPLAERREDIPVLSQYFLEELNREADKQLAGFTAECLDALTAYWWPGNVEELQTAVIGMFQSSPGPLIGCEHLPERIRYALRAARYPRPSEEKISLDDFLNRVQEELIRRAMKVAKANKAKAARLLGISRPRLLRLWAQMREKADRQDSGGTQG